MSRLVCFAALCLAASACSPSGYLSGTIDGESIFVRDSVYIPVRHPESGSSIGGMLMLSDQPGLCRTIRGGHLPRKAELVYAAIFRAALAPPVEGDYTVIAKGIESRSNFALGAAIRYDSTCALRRAETHSILTGGVVTLEELDIGRSGAAAGSLDIDVGVQRDHLTGRFHAEICDAADAFMEATCGG